MKIVLIWADLGGDDDGYVLVSDVDEFFHAQMPANRTKYIINVPLFAHMKLALATLSL